MKLLGVVSQKGGVGKTTVALNVAYALAQLGQRVLLVDADPQGAIGLSLQKLKPSAGLAGYIARDVPLDEVTLRTRLGSLQIVPMGNIAIEDTHAFASRLADGQEVRRLQGDAEASHDLVVIDTPSGFTGATLGVMRVADAVLSPLQAEPLAMLSASQLLQVIAALRASGDAPALAGFVLTMLDLRTPESLAVATEAWTEFPSAAVMQTAIPRDPIFLKASAAGVPVGLLARNPPPIAGLFNQIALELDSRLGLHEQPGDDGPISLLA